MISRKDKAVMKQFLAWHKRSENKHLSNLEILKAWAGKCLGHGHARSVYELAGTDSIVIKVERHPRDTSFSNISEWLNWWEVDGWEVFSKWLAPCLGLTDNGVFLLQERAVPVTKKAELPAEIPNLFLDRKIQNWGLINGEPKCVDYAHLNYLASYPSKLVMKRANWWVQGKQRKK